MHLHWSKESDMRYHCQCYRNEQMLAKLSSLEKEKLGRDTAEYLARYQHAPTRQLPSTLSREGDILCVLLCDGSVTSTDGATRFPEISKDAFFTIDARDLNDCLRIVSQYPLLPLGGIEIRPG